MLIFFNTENVCYLKYEDLAVISDLSRQTLAKKNNLQGVGWFWSVFGTLYSLVTAFILVTVWGQFNNFNGLIARKAEVIASIWNYTDYLNDKKISKAMEKALLAYKLPRAKSPRYSRPSGSKSFFSFVRFIRGLKSLGICERENKRLRIKTNIGPKSFV